MTVLEAQIKEQAKLAADYSSQGVELINKGNRRQGHALMRQAYDASKCCQVLIQQLKRRQG